MTQDILIVGLKHFLNEESIAYLLNTLTPEHEISLVLAEDNPVDKNAIQVWMPFSEDGLKKNMQIGFVSSDYSSIFWRRRCRASSIRRSNRIVCSDILREKNTTSAMPILSPRTKMRMTF